MGVKSFFSRLIAVLLLAVLVVGLLPTQEARADVTDGVTAGAEVGSDATTYRHDMTYRAVTADLDVWENGGNIYVKTGDQQFSYAMTYAYYLVTVSEYLKDDGSGDYVTLVSILFSQAQFMLNTATACILDDGSVYYELGTSLGRSDKLKGYYVVIDDGVATSNSGYSMTSGGSYGFRVIGASGYTGYLFQTLVVYSSPYYSGLESVYSNCAIYNNAGDYIAANPLPGAPKNDDGNNYKTVFRMLTDNAIVYNTYYYNSVYLSGADEISCMGTGGYVRVDATNLADGANAWSRQVNPCVMCYISYYGTAYDIVYTNDDTLCELLGISMPSTFYDWDVTAQEWKASSGSSSSSSEGFHFLTNLSLAENFSRWLESNGHSTLSGIAHFFAFESIEDFTALFDSFISGVVYIPSSGEFALRADLIESESDSAVDFSESPDAETIKDDVRKYLRYSTPNNTYVWSLDSASDSSVSGSDTGNTDTSSGSSGSLEVPVLNVTIDSIKEGMADGISSVDGFFSGVLSSARSILSSLGSIPAIFAAIFGFLPSEFIAAVGIGLNLWLLPSLLGLARTGLKAFGGLCSTIFTFITSFF